MKTASWFRPQHVVIMVGVGQIRSFINGKYIGSTPVQGDLSKWRMDHQLMFGNETDGSRPWRGRIACVAIYEKTAPARFVEVMYQSAMNVPQSRKLGGPGR